MAHDMTAPSAAGPIEEHSPSLMYWLLGGKKKGDR